MTDLAVSLETRNRVAEAQALFERAAPVLEKSPEAESPGMAVLLAYRGSLRSRAGRYPEAAEDLTCALGLFEKANGPNHPRLVGPLLSLGWVYLYQNRPTMAEEPLRRAATIAATAFAPEHEIHGSILSAYATVLRKTGRKKEARELEKRAQVIEGGQRGAARRAVVHISDLVGTNKAQTTGAQRRR